MNETKIDLSILRKMPELDKRVVLAVRPLAPLSMVDELPGSFYKTLKHPSKKMICGLFENMLGWHFDKKCGLKYSKIWLKYARNLMSNWKRKSLYGDQHICPY